MRCFLAHYKNKYPKGRVDFSEDKLDAYDEKGNLRVSLRKGGNGQLMDVGSSVGALDAHDLDPIPKNTRAYKHHKDDSVAPSEEFAERLEIAEAVAVKGKVLSINEYEKAGFKLDDKGNLTDWPKEEKAAPAKSEAGQAAQTAE